MVVEDEGDGVAQTHDYEAPGEQVEILEHSADASESSREHKWIHNGNHGGNA